MTQTVSKAVGIDLGTTNSVVALLDPTDTEIVVHKDARSHSPTTPSCVWGNPATGELVVGRMALLRLGRAPEPVQSVKRMMGQQTTVRVGDRELSPEQVSAAILAEMKRQIEQDAAALETPAAAWKVDRAIITVPAYFDQPQIDATRRAAELAGLEVLELLHEPTAAACHHCWRTGTRDGTFLVYDLGGGTFDVSVVRATAGAFEVIGIRGNNRLGGDDIDTALAERLRELLADEGWALDLDLKGNEEDRLRFSMLKLLAEGAKKALSDSTEYFLRDSGRLTDQEGRAVLVETLLERADLEEIARPFIERTLDYCREAIADAGARAGITIGDIDEIILAGGSTHMPLVREMIRTALCGPDGAECDAPVYEKVDTVVALGAAIRAAAVGGLTITDPEHTVRVHLNGTSTAGAATTHVGGRVAALAPGLDLSGGYVRLTAPGHQDEADLGKDGSFSFIRIPMHGAESLLSFEIFDGAGAHRATVSRALTSAAQPMTGGLSSTAISSKDILLEVTRSGRRERRTLIPALRPLPTSATFTFFHPGDTELLLFPLYQGARQIQVIKFPVPGSTPRGMEINFEIRLDRHSLITVQGSLGEQTFQASVELPAERTVPTQAEADALQRRFNETTELMAAGPRNTAHVRWDRVMSGYRGALERGDVAQAVHEFEELEAILEGLGESARVLTPPKSQFDQLVRECVSENAHLATLSRQRGLVYDHEDMSKAIEAQRAQGEQAFGAGDQRGYGEAISHLQAYRDHMQKTYQQWTSPIQATTTTAQQADAQIRAGISEAATVRQLTQAMTRADLTAEVDTIERRLLALQRDVESDPSRAQNGALSCRTQLANISRTLTSRGDDGSGGRLVEDY